MKLTPYVAQSIVDRTMKLLDYNINIMDEKGIIIGSGDKSRLNTYHQGAEKVLKENKTVEIKKGDKSDLVGSKEGVNLPIRLNEKVVGVVGITGDPGEIGIYGAMVQAMAELMLEESFYWEQTRIEEEARFSLVNDLIRKDPGKDSSILHTRGDILGYDLSLPRIAVVFEIESKEKKQALLEGKQDTKKLLGSNLRKQAKKFAKSLPIKSQDIFAWGIGDRFVLLRTVEEDSGRSVAKEDLTEIFSSLERVKVTAGIGSRCLKLEDIPKSFDQALQALEVGRRLFGRGQVYYSEDLGLEKFIDKVGGDFRYNFSFEILKDLIQDKNNNSQLLETARTFLNNNLKPGDAARELFVHRNTLTYRINKIKEKTGLDLNCLEDALKFKMALLCWEYDKEN